MNFERNKNPKETMEIGMDSNSIPIIGLSAEIMIRSNYYSTDSFHMKKRRFKKLENALPLLDMENIRMKDFFKYFKPSLKDSWPFFDIFRRSIIYLRIWNYVGKADLKRIEGKIELVNGFFHKENVEKVIVECWKRAEITFSLLMDYDQIDESLEDREIKYVKYKGKYFSVKPGQKILMR